MVASGAGRFFWGQSGLGLALFSFVSINAPDVALTQLMVETLTGGLSRWSCAGWPMVPAVAQRCRKPDGLARRVWRFGGPFLSVFGSGGQSADHDCR